MPFTGKATYDGGATLPDLVEDVADLVGIISPYETPLLDALGDPQRAALGTHHEWLEDSLLPNRDSVAITPTNPTTDQTIDVSTASSFRVGDQIKVGAEIMLIAVVDSGAGTIGVARGYGGTTPESLAVGDGGRTHAEATFAEVVFESTAQDKHHQVYVDGRLAGTTLSTAERVIVAAVPEAAASLLEVVAVDADDRLTDFGAALTGFGDAEAARVELSWSGGRYLDDNLDHFEVYGGPAGSIDYGSPLNAEPIEALIDGRNLGGFGRGGWGRGGFGRSACAFSLVTAKFAPGTYDFDILAVDTEGNVTDGPPRVTRVEVRSFPRPPTDLAVSGYDDQTQTATLAWSPSEDL